MKFDYGKWYFGIEWNSWKYYPDNIYFFNYLEKSVRYFGYRFNWYDGAWYSFGFWFFNVTWRW